VESFTPFSALFTRTSACAMVAHVVSVMRPVKVAVVVASNGSAASARKPQRRRARWEIMGGWTVRFHSV
jgi:hypothetical protein